MDGSLKLKERMWAAALRGPTMTCGERAEDDTWLLMGIGTWMWHSKSKDKGGMHLTIDNVRVRASGDALRARAVGADITSGTREMKCWL